MHILVTFGTRPEIIKLGPVCQELSRRPDAELDVFWTGQHIELAAGLLDFFEITVTHNGSDVMSEPGLAGKFGRMTSRSRRILHAKRYDWIVVQGDTTTAAAAATAGFMNRVPVAHVEAGPPHRQHRILRGRRNSTAGWWPGRHPALRLDHRRARQSYRRGHSG